MAFQLVYFSQQDPKWKDDILGNGTGSDTIGYVGCALTAVTMLLDGHGYNETPKSLNQKLKNAGGFVGASIAWSAVSKIYPNVALKAFIPCGNSDAPLAQIDAALAAGQPAVVQVDRSPAPGIQTHWVVLYARKGNDYLMLDPWPYQTDINQPDYLMKRYAQGRNLQGAISHVILYEAYGTNNTPPPAPPTTGTPTSSGATARVKASVTWGLNIRSSVDTSSMQNVVTVAQAGALLTLLEADGASKVGGVNQWVRVRTADGKEGFTAAWYLENVAATPPASTPTTPVTTPTTTTTPPVSTPAPQPAQTPSANDFVIVVNARVGRLGANIYASASQKAKILATQPMKSKLVVLDDAKKAQAKIGKANQWIKVRTQNGVEGFVLATQVKLP